MSKTKTQSKHCKFQKSENHLKEKRGRIYIRDSNGINSYLLTPKQVKVEHEINPINSIKRMKKKTEEEYPYIYNLYNIPEGFYDQEREKAMQSINIYLGYRKKLIEILQKMIIKYDCHDFTFYQTLFFIDNFLSHDITIDMPEKTILYYLIGYFLCAIKFKETDIYEPEFDSFLDLEKGIYLSPKKIALYEVICLKRIKYNIFTYSAYDWIEQFASNGVIFNTEVDHSNEIIMINGHRHSLINTVNKYGMKLLLNITTKETLFKYSPMHIALSIIQLSREKYLDKSIIKPKLFSKLIDLYGFHFDEYEDCYKEIKEEIKRIIKEKNKEESENDKEKEEYNYAKKYSVDKIDKRFNTLYGNKLFLKPKNMRSINNINSIKDEGSLIYSTKKHSDKNNILLTRNQKNKSVKKNHLSIDCSIKVVSNNAINTYIAKNNSKEKVEVNLKKKQKKRSHVSFMVEQVQKKEVKELNQKMKERNIINLKLTKEIIQSSKKLPKIKLDENNKNEQNNNFDINIIRRSYKFSSISSSSKSVKIKAPFP